MEPLDRSYTTYSQSMNIIMTLTCGLEVTQDHWKWYHSKVWIRFPIHTP